MAAGLCISNASDNDNVAIPPRFISQSLICESGTHHFADEFGIFVGEEDAKGRVLSSGRMRSERVNKRFNVLTAKRR
jgi:hypothetical protein